jgi:hypothetical protein
MGAGCSVNLEATMPRPFVLLLPLLAGCAAASTEAEQPAPERTPIITRVATSEGAGVAKVADVAEMRVELVDEACRTGDRMPTARLDVGNLAPMPSAQPTRLPYIPNLCPVIAAPAQKPAMPAVLQRDPKRVRTAPVQP